MLFELPLDTRETQGLAFTCLPGCGWCCTHPPEVTAGEEARLRELRPNVRVGFDGERSFLRLQGGCGACQFLDGARSCTVYEARPNHCRWFPFHVYFGRTVEVLVNRSCPGVVDTPGASVLAAAREALATADPEVVRRHVSEAADAHEQFRVNCEDAGGWVDVDSVLARLAAPGGALLTRDGIEAAAGRHVGDVLEAAATAFEHGDPTRRPYLVDPEFRWLVFQRRAGRVGVAELAIGGRLEVRKVIPLPAWEDPAPPLRAALAPHLAALIGRECFAGSVFDRVDEEEYGLALEDAAGEEAAAVAVDLVLRARLVEAMRPGLAPAEIALEARRFYDSDFLDRPAIGAWL